MGTDVATEPQMFSAQQQLDNAKLIRDFIESRHDTDPGRYDRYIAEDARILLESRADYPVPEKSGIGPGVLKKNGSELTNLAFHYEIEIHNIYTCGPLVVVSRTDTRKEPGKPDKPVPALGIFVVKGGKIVDWADRYR